MSSLSDSPQYLIGPRLYPAFIALTRWILPMVLVVSAVVNAAVYLVTQPTPVIGELLAITAMKTVVAVLATVVIMVALFAILERALPAEQIARCVPSRWTAARDARCSGTTSYSPRLRLMETIGALVFIVFLALIPLVPTSFVYVGQLNDGGSFLNQELWNGWLPAWYGFLAIFAGVNVWTLGAPRPSMSLRVVSLGVTFAFAAFLSAMVLTQDVMDPAVLGDAAWSRVPWLDPALVAVIWAVTLWSVLLTARARRDMILR